jgi:alpha-L-fucosidase
MRVPPFRARVLLVAGLTRLVVHPAAAAPPVTPSAAQVRWQELELGVSFHFGLAAFVGADATASADAESGEAGRGSGARPASDPRAFDPARIDPKEWVAAAREAGARYVVLLARERSGFCLWPTRTTSLSVASSPWKDGKGDLVREVADAAREAGLDFGVSLEGGGPLITAQLEELLSGYGPLVAVRFDGPGEAGGPGAVGGAAGAGAIAEPDGRGDTGATPLDEWRRRAALIRKHQPGAVLSAPRALDIAAGIPSARGAEDERGFAPEPCWNVVAGEGGETWMPVECVAALGARGRPRSLAELVVLYHRSAGRGANLLLGVRPERSGLLAARDAAILRELGAEIRRRFGRAVARTSGRGTELALDVGGREVDHVLLREDLREGERVRSYVVELDTGAGWKAVAAGESIGRGKLHWFEPARASRIRLRVLDSAAEPALRELSAHTVVEPAAALYAEARARRGAKAVAALGQAIERLPAFGPFHLLRAFLCEEEGRLEEAAADFALVLDLEPGLASLHHARAGVLFRLERFPEALEEYDAAVASGTPHDGDSCWERGLAWYYAGDFRSAAKQFERYHRVGPTDVENGIWRFLSIGAEDGLEAARRTMLEYPRLRGPPFPALLDLYLGAGSPEAVLAGSEDPTLELEAREEILFFGHYYVAKYLELRGEREAARTHLEKALAHRVHPFMHRCAEIDRKRLEAPKNGN